MAAESGKKAGKRQHDQGGERAHPAGGQPRDGAADRGLRNGRFELATGKEGRLGL